MIGWPEAEVSTNRRAAGDLETVLARAEPEDDLDLT